MRYLSLFRQLRTLRSAPLRAILHRALTLSGDYRSPTGATRSLVSITLEVTYRCNLRCEFCFLKEGLLNQPRAELSRAEIGRLADQAHRFGASFYLTGGEPFLRSDLPELVAEIKARGLKVGVNTNGLLVTPEMGRRIRAAGLDYVVFSLHGPREIHDCLEDRPGAFEKVMEHLGAFARDKGRTRVLVNCVVARANSDALSSLPPLLSSLPIDGLTYQHETYLTAREVARQKRVWEVLFPDRPLPLVYQSTGYGARDLDALDGEVQSIAEGGKSRRWPFPVFWKPLLRREELRRWYSEEMEVRGRCLYLWTDVRVEPDGTVNACQVMPTPMGNVRDSGLAEILNGELYRGFRRKNIEAGGVFPACARCCKLYRNPVTFRAGSPVWQEWGDPAAVGQPVRST